MATKFIPVWIKKATPLLNGHQVEHGAVFHLTRWTRERAGDGEVDADHECAALWRYAEDIGILGEDAAA